MDKIDYESNLVVEFEKLKIVQQDILTFGMKQKDIRKYAALSLLIVAFLAVKTFFFGSTKSEISFWELLSGFSVTVSAATLIIYCSFVVRDTQILLNLLNDRVESHANKIFDNPVLGRLSRANLR